MRESRSSRDRPAAAIRPPETATAMAERAAADDQDLSFRFGLAISIAGMRSRLAAGPGRP